MLGLAKKHSTLKIYALLFQDLRSPLSVRSSPTKCLSKAYSRIIPTVGMTRSHAGNNTFPAWEPPQNNSLANRYKLSSNTSEAWKNNTFYTNCLVMCQSLRNFAPSLNNAVRRV